jgi:hypothetical protein
LEQKDALPAQELSELLRQSYELVFAKLPKKTRDAISRAPKPRKKRRLRKNIFGGGKRK